MRMLWIWAAPRQGPRLNYERFPEIGGRSNPATLQDC